MKATKADGTPIARLWPVEGPYVVIELPYSESKRFWNSPGFYVVDMTNLPNPKELEEDDNNSSFITSRISHPLVTYREWFRTEQQAQAECDRELRKERWQDLLSAMATILASGITAGSRTRKMRCFAVLHVAA